MSSVKLAIRLRPFTEKELRTEKERVPVVDVVDNNTVTITNIKVSVSGAGDSRERVRKYYADYTFDSCCPNTHPHYASQEKVFEDIGREVIASVSGGRSACVLAYGQSATGKTHTMMGSDAHPGLIPRLCKALYELQPFELTVSFLEIYNERVHDLLAGEAVPPPSCRSLPRRRGNARKDLRVREHPTRGTYVQNLRRVSVQDAEALLCVVGEGARRRRTAATRRNATSSRSHALIEIATPQATLHLADLAGSEKASWEGCGGGRQKEGANINKSLVALSNVISALVSGGGRGRFVPYRDSALTWLLKDCFTGGARAFIIATVSPSAACYGESASTLRWAARARQLPAPRAITCASVASRAALQAQLNNLIAELARNHIHYIPETGAISYEDEHWTLRQKDETSIYKDLDTDTIGNIMSAIHPKTDANNSESTASSVASGSSDVINTMDKTSKLTNEINKEIDKLFAPTLERTSSGDDFKIVAPLRNKRRQCRSQEVLLLDEAPVSQNLSLLTTLPSQSEMQINNMQHSDKPKVQPITILHENQRAEIVASVTERLYTKLKKKEEAAVSKVESIVDKRIVEPLSELKICTNARQRLMELSQKAIRNRRRIGIPAYTQTRSMVIRMRDQGIDAQTDLLSYIAHNRHLYTLSRDVATETTPMTPRCKEVAVGAGSLDYHDRATETKKVARKNSLMMTDSVAKYDRCSQTPPVVPPPRRKRLNNFSKHVTSNENNNCTEECSSVPVISINISQMYPVDSESQSSDDNLENVIIKNSPSMVTSTPDLLTNHSAVEIKNIDDSGNNINSASVSVRDEVKEPVKNDDLKDESDEFSDTDDCILPKVTVDASGKTKYSEIKDIILGRNKNVYPYNIVLSPPRERDHSKRIVKFKDIDMSQAINASSQTSWEFENNENETIKSNCTSTASDKDCSIDHESIQTDSTDSSKMETDSFIWKKNIGSKTSSLRKNYVPVYKSSKYKTTKARFYKDFAESDGNIDSYNKSYGICTSPDSIREISSSDSRDTDTKQPRRRKPYHNTRNRIAHTCDSLNEYENVERKLFDSCNYLEETANKYENYLSNYQESMNVDGVGATRRPKDYLHHLLQLRREVVKAENDLTDSSAELSRE